MASNVLNVAISNAKGATTGQKTAAPSQKNQETSAFADVLARVANQNPVSSPAELEPDSIELENESGDDDE
jgi:hypothetical protein